MNIQIKKLLDWWVPCFEPEVFRGKGGPSSLVTSLDSVAYWEFPLEAEGLRVWRKASRKRRLQLAARYLAPVQKAPSGPGVSKNAWWYQKCRKHGIQAHHAYLGGSCEKCQSKKLAG